MTTIYEVWATIQTGQVWPCESEYQCVRRYFDKSEAEGHAKKIGGTVQPVEVH
jgi:hypothetical protein